VPTTEDNLRIWTETEWDSVEELWSSAWGRASTIWWGSLVPRIGKFLPAGRILEIAPGNGRFTQFLERLCDELVLVDLTPRCIELCRERFRGRSHLRYHVNDGYSLAALEPGSVDFAFSFDSLPHATHAVVTSYVRELRRILSPAGVAFLHHSNLARYITNKEEERAFPNPHWRDVGVSAPAIREAIEEAGLVPLVQEEMNWGSGTELTDCLTLFTLPGSPWVHPFRRAENPDFMNEARGLARLFELWQPEGPDYFRLLGKPAPER